MTDLRSRAVINISYDLLAEILDLPDGVRILRVDKNDFTAEAKILVEGQRDGLNYPWSPGHGVPSIDIHCKEEIREKLVRDNGFL